MINVEIVVTVINKNLSRCFVVINHVHMGKIVCIWVDYYVHCWNSL